MHSENMVFSPGTMSYYRDIEQDHEDLSERLRKTLYYGKLPGTDRPSMPLTDLAVTFFQEAAPRELGKLDSYLAASTSRSACMSPTSMTVGMLYVRRLRKHRPEYLTQISSSELFLISMMMASKFLYDEGIDDEVFNDEWAVSGDLETEDMNQLERDFLHAIDWQLFVRPGEFADMLHSIEKRIALQQGLERGWFTYTDMFLLSQDLRLMPWNDLTTELSKVFSAASFAYLAGIFTMIGSTMLATSTSSALMTLGTSTVLPLCLKLAPMLTLYPELSAKVILGSRSLLPEGQVHTGSMKVAGINRTGSDQFGPLPDVELNDFGENLLEESADQFPEWMSAKNDLEASAKVKGQNKDNHGNGLLNNFLPPFLALVTLKDCILEYAFGARLTKGKTHRHAGSHLDGQTNNDEGQMTDENDLEDALEPMDIGQMSEFCSSGPCLQDSWPNCWNISSNVDWNNFLSYTTSSYGTKRPCCDQCVLNQASSSSIFPDNRPSYNPNFQNCGRMTVENAALNGQFNGHEQTNHGSLKCCCSFNYVETASWLKGSLSSSIVDLNLRFSTQAMIPVTA